MSHQDGVASPRGAPPAAADVPLPESPNKQNGLPVAQATHTTSPSSLGADDLKVLSKHEAQEEVFEVVSGDEDNDGIQLPASSTSPVTPEMPECQLEPKVGLPAHQYGCPIDELDEVYAEDSALKSEAEEEESSDDSSDEDLEEGDSASDVMNMPPSYIAPSHRPQKLDDVLVGTCDPTQDEADQLKQCRLAIEFDIEEDRIEHENEHHTTIDEEVENMTSSSQTMIDSSFGSPLVRCHNASSSGPSFAQGEDQADTVQLTPDVLAVDPDKLAALMSDLVETESEEKAISEWSDGDVAIKEKSEDEEKEKDDDENEDENEDEDENIEEDEKSAEGDAKVEPDEEVAQPEILTPHRPYLHAVLCPSPSYSMQAQAGSPAPSDSDTPAKRSGFFGSISGQDDTKQGFSAVGFPPSKNGPSTPGDVTTHSQKRVAFDPNPAIETPFTNTLKYFKSYQDKERDKLSEKENSPFKSPNKSRRNASLPEEIAALTKRASGDDADIGGGEDSEQENLGQFRDEDLAPLDPVSDLEVRDAGDLIMPHMSLKTIETQLPDTVTMEDNKGNSVTEIFDTVTENDGENQRVVKIAEATNDLDISPTKAMEQKVVTYEVKIFAPDQDFTYRISTSAAYSDISKNIHSYAIELGVEDRNADELVARFLDDPQSFVVVDSEVNDASQEPDIVEISYEPQVIDFAQKSMVNEVATKLKALKNTQESKAIEFARQSRAVKLAQKLNVSDLRSKVEVTAKKPPKDTDILTKRTKKHEANNDPVAINVIAILPKALFWTALYPFACLADAAYSAVRERFNRLTVRASRQRMQVGYAESGFTEGGDIEGGDDN